MSRRATDLYALSMLLLDGIVDTVLRGREDVVMSDETVEPSDVCNESLPYPNRLRLLGRARVAG